MKMAKKVKMVNRGKMGTFPKAQHEDQSFHVQLEPWWLLLHCTVASLFASLCFNQSYKKSSSSNFVKIALWDIKGNKNQTKGSWQGANERHSHIDAKGNGRLLKSEVHRPEPPSGVHYTRFTSTTSQPVTPSLCLLTQYGVICMAGHPLEKLTLLAYTLICVVYSVTGSLRLNRRKGKCQVTERARIPLQQLYFLI